MTLKKFITLFRPIGVFHRIQLKRGLGLDVVPSRFCDEIIWFSNSQIRTRDCKKCVASSLCVICKEKYDGKFLLLKNFTVAQVRKELLNMPRIPLNDFNDALYIFKIAKTFEVLTCSRIRYLEKKYNCHFYFYSERKERTSKMRKGELIAERKPQVIKYTHKMHFKLQDQLPTTKMVKLKAWNCF